MIEKRYRELMNQELDGANTPDESALLRSFLASSEEARRMYDELRGLAGMFAAAGDIAPPRDMKRAIMAAIAEREAIGGARRTERRRFFDVLAPRKKVACAFAAGVAFGLVTLVILLRAMPQGGGLDRKDLYGSLAGRHGAGDVIASESVSIEAAGISGRVTAQYRDNALTVTLDLAAQREFEVVLSPAGRLPVESFGAPSCGAFDIRTDTAGVAFKAASGCSIVVTFRDEAGAHPAVNVAVGAGGGRIFEHTIVRGRK
jgi:hypothetical protein